MNDNHLPGDRVEQVADQVLDRVLAEYSAAEPGFGFEARVAAGVRERLQRRASWRSRLLAPAWGVAVVVIALLATYFFTRPEELVRQEPARAAVRATTPPAEPVQPGSPASVVRAEPVQPGSPASVASTEPVHPRRQATAHATAPAAAPETAARAAATADSFFTAPPTPQERMLQAYAAAVVEPLPQPMQPMQAAPGEPIRPAVRVGEVSVLLLEQPAPVVMSSLTNQASSR